MKDIKVLAAQAAQLMDGSWSWKSQKGSLIRKELAIEVIKQNGLDPCSNNDVNQALTIADAMIEEAKQ